MKYYDQNGRPLSSAECRRRTELYREDLFRRVLTPTEPCMAAPRERAVSAHSSRSQRNRSARLQRTRSAKVHRPEPTLTAPTLFISVTSPPRGPKTASDSGRSTSPVSLRARSSSPSDPRMASPEEKRQESPTVTSPPVVEKPPDRLGDSLKEEGEESARKVSKAAFGLRIAVADFTQKVRDNEGMGISTFTYLDEDGEASETAPQKVISNAGEPEDRRISVRSYHQFRSSVLHLTLHRILEKTPPGEKFRRAVKTVNMLLKACTSHAEETKRAQKRMMTFTDLQEEIEQTASEIKESYFDLSYFKARREKSISFEAKEILRTHPSLRTEEQIQKVVLALNSAVEVFGEFPINMQESLVRVGWYEKFGPKRVIIRQGHTALNFYFIITGITVVTVARHNRMTGETYAETVAFLKKGNSFGELALMYGGKRSATVSCKDEVELLAVSREDFIDIFMSMDADVEPDHVRFLRHVPILASWPLSELPFDDPSICLFTYFRRGTVLCRDSKHADWIYIVVTGHCRVIKDLRCQESKIQRLRTKDRMVEWLQEDRDTHSLRYYAFLHKREAEAARLGARLNHNSHSSSSQKTRSSTPAMPKKIYIQLKVLGPRDVFGLETIAFELYGESNSVTFVSDGAECVLIDRAFFTRHMTDSYMKILRKELQPFPSVETLEDKLQADSNWHAYRRYLLEHIQHQRQYTESMLY